MRVAREKTLVLACSAAITIASVFAFASCKKDLNELIKKEPKSQVAADSAIAADSVPAKINVKDTLRINFLPREKTQENVNFKTVQPMADTLMLIPVKVHPLPSAEN